MGGGDEVQVKQRFKKMRLNVWELKWVQEGRKGEMNIGRGGGEGGAETWRGRKAGMLHTAAMWWVRRRLFFFFFCTPKAASSMKGHDRDENPF